VTTALFLLGLGMNAPTSSQSHRPRITHRDCFSSKPKGAQSAGLHRVQHKVSFSIHYTLYTTRITRTNLQRQAGPPCNLQKSYERRYVV